ncbi:MAG: hypothetical protein LBP35_05980 [Candidatus Ancillula trichonymphae]|nr:hypothetical protein [Candidatus Ancillula trichonymphae]
MSRFDAGLIITDSEFYTHGTMSTAQIQDFLGNINPNCQGTFCAKNYTAQTVTQGGKYCGHVDGGRTLSLAQMISEVSAICNISEKVLLVTLQKEEGIITYTDQAALQARYRTAMGYGCPDTTPGVCDEEFFGLYNQLYWAANQFRMYRANPHNYNVRAGVTNNILYSPNTSCGTKQVFVYNDATAALYNYTPYTPNPAALATSHGTGDECSAYGNRNFYSYYTEWFGQTGNWVILDRSADAVNYPYAVYRLVNRISGCHFFTSSAAERDNLTLQDYKYEGIAFYEPQTGAAVYRFFRGFEHFYTSSVLEARSLLQNGASLDGVDWHATDNGQPVYRLVNKASSEHLWTMNRAEVDSLVATGQWALEGTSFKAYPDMIDDSSYTYKLTNQTTRQIQLTSSTREVANIVNAKDGWSYTGIAWKNDTNGTVGIYELRVGDEKFYTANEAEKNSLVSGGASVLASSKFKVTGTGGEILRLLNTTYRTHEFTTNKQYASALVATGQWQLEGVAWRSDAIKPAAQNVYRLVSASEHFWTRNVGEVEIMQVRGWNCEGVGWKASSAGTPVTRLYGGGKHFWTADQSEVALLKTRGYSVEGVAFSSAGNVGVHRLVNRHSGEHFYTANPAEKDHLVQSGWTYEGVGMRGV